MAWKIELDIKVQKELKKLDKQILIFISSSLKEFGLKFCDKYEEELIKNGKIKHLKSSYKNMYRLKLRTYRIIYKKENDILVIYVARVAHRREAYK